MKRTMIKEKKLGKIDSRKNAAVGYLRQRPCNLCGIEFSTLKPFRVFCNKCRVEDERYLFAEWLPGGSLTEVESLTAAVAA